MNRPGRLRYGVVRLPVALVAEFARALRCPKAVPARIGVRRQIVDEVLKRLDRAMRNQIDGLVEVDAETVNLIFRESIEAIGWFKDLLDDYFDENGEQT